MDLLYKRYASPFDYLDTLLDYGTFARGIRNVWETSQDDKCWELYLSIDARYRDKNFEDWKKELFSKAQTKKPMSKAQVVATIEKSQNILKNFNPLKQEKDNKE